MSEIAPRATAERLAAGEIELVDVRTPEEWAEGRIAGARHVELAELSARAQEIPRERPVVFYCHTGGRSAMATEAFRGAGWDALNMTGGIEAWEQAGLPVEHG